MGQEACAGCKRPSVADTSLSMFRPSPLQASWADAVKKNAIAAVKALHSKDRDLIDEPVDGYNICAIHVVIQRQYYELLDYLLTQRFDINVQDTKEGNTALHLAVLHEDSQAIEKLFTYEDIDESVKNYEGKEPIYICSPQFKREYIKNKERGKALGVKRRKRERKDNHNGYADHSNLERVDEVNYLTLNNGYTADNNVLNGKYRNKDKSISKFGQRTGVDIDEMGMYLQQCVNTGIWNRLTNNKDIIKRVKDVEKILNAICILTKMAKKRSLGELDNGVKFMDDEKPDKEAIHQLNIQICEILKQNDGKIRLNEKEFQEHFHEYLFEIHAKLIDNQYED